MTAIDVREKIIAGDNSQEFHRYIYNSILDKVMKEGLTFFEATIELCELWEIDVQDVGKIIASSDAMKQSFSVEAVERNLIKDNGAKLDV